LIKKVPILGERDNALRWLRRGRDRTIDSAALLPVNPFQEPIHVACEAQEHVVLFEPERTPPTLVFATKTGRQSPEGEVYARSRFSPCSECAVSVPPLLKLEVRCFKWPALI
jgi:hypothetical protein